MQSPLRPSTLQSLGLAPGARRRGWAALLVLALALASFMHVAHSHEAGAPSVHKQHCGYCGTFDRGSAPPPASFAVLPVAPAPALVVPAPAPSRAPFVVRTASQPRAPPHSQA